MFYKATWENSKENLASYAEKKYIPKTKTTFCGFLNYHS